jgi:DNA polymerase-3 subunit gamma/tau
MAYQSLYRKYRPQRFSELVGQEHVTNALRNAVRDDRVGHAYLFSGPRGTGKTTTARILAKALNCTDLGADGEPCGVCESCVAIAGGTFMDLVEIDAASNRGVEDARRLREQVITGMGPGARRKVYILDEVHMLTTDASNTLLKTLEEPPAHVVFVLATTSPEQVLPTIRSRTQHFEFTLLTTEQLEARLADLLSREGISFDSDALTVIARAGAGSARDAESLLDQALAHGADTLAGAAVADLFGGTPAEARARILDSIAAEDAAGALVALGELLEAGHDPRRVAEDLLVVARDAFLLSAGGGRVAVDAPAEEQQRLTGLGEALGNAALVRVIETIGQAVVDMRGTDAADPRLVLEVALVRLSRRDAGPPLQTVVERIERLERAVAARDGRDPATAGGDASPPAAPPARPRPKKTIGGVRAEATPAPAPDPPAAVADPSPPADPPPAAEPPAPTAHAGAGDEQPIDLDDVILAWAALLPDLPVATRSAVQNAQPLRIEGDVLVFGVAPTLLTAARERFKLQADNVRSALTERLGRRVKFNLVAAEEFSMSSAPTAAPVANESPDEEIDLRDVIDAPNDDVPPPVSMLRDQIGATVVDEVPRD